MIARITIEPGDPALTGLGDVVVDFGAGFADGMDVSRFGVVKQVER